MDYRKQVSLDGVMAALFGLKAILLLFTEVVLFALGDNYPWVFVFGHAAMLCGMVSVGLVVRGLFLEARVREQKCFDAGREVGKSEARDLRSVS